MKKNAKNMSPIKEAFTIAIIYGFFGIFWLILTDVILSLVINNIYLYKIIGMYKGCFFILMTMIFLFYILNEKLFLYKNSLNSLHFSLKRISSVEDKLRINMKRLEEKQEELTTTYQRYRLAVDGFNDAIWEWDIINDKYYISPKWRYIIMGSNDERKLTFNNWVNYIHKDDKNKFLAFLNLFLSKGSEYYQYIYRLECNCGNTIWIYSKGKAIRNSKGKVIRMAGSHTDITNQFKLREDIKKNNSMIEKVMNNASNCFIIWESSGNIIKVNPHVTKITNINEFDLLNRNWFDIFANDLLIEERIKIINDIKLDNKINYYNSHLVKEDGTNLFLLWTSRILYKNNDDDNFEIISIGTDITELKQVKNELSYLAYYDKLTGLPNIHLFEKHINDLIKQNMPFSLIYLDIDNIKHINDTLGHLAGEKLIQGVGDELKDIKCPNLSARLSGDDFLIVFNNIIEINQLKECIEKLIKKLRKSWKLENKEYFITYSLGISRFPENGKDFQTLLKNADTARYNAKESGKDNYQLFENKMNEKNIIYLQTISDLKKAIDNNEFVVLYQPLVKLNTGKLFGVEALIRWNNKEKGLILPKEFINISEETGIINDIDKFVFEEVCKQKVKWDKLGYNNLKYSINISPKRFKNKFLFQEIKDIINKYNINPQFLQLEITESAVMENLDQAIDILYKIKSLGIEIALDDFGKGFSSLTYLKKLPIDIVKMDRDFISDISFSYENEAIIKSIIQLVHTLKKEVIAEGVETKEQLLFLKDNKCDIGQGYLFEKAVKTNVVETLLNENICFIK